MVSAVVTHYKTPQILRLCLDSLSESFQKIPGEIIVADSDAQEETGEMIKDSFPQARYLPFEGNVGFAKLVNAGLRIAKGEYILILNADMVLAPGSVGRMVEYMQENPRIGILGPQLLDFNGSIQDSCFRFYRPQTIVFRRTWLGKTKKGKEEIARFVMSDFNHKEIKEVDWLQGAALLARKKAVDEVGLMDESFFMYFEDVDWCRRFHAKNWQVAYFPQAQMYHYHGRGSRKAGGIFDLLFNKYAWIHIFSAVKYFWKYR